MASLIGEGRLVITEVTGKKRELVLYGTSMPFAPSGFGGVRLRSSKKYYAGNPTASVQVLGTEEVENTFSGQWIERNLLNSGKVLFENVPVVRVKDLVEVIEDLTRSMQLLRVNWAGMERYGFMSFPEPQWKSLRWVFWTLSFDWTSRLERADAPHFFSSTVDMVEEITGAETAIIAAIATIRETFEGMDEIQRGIIEAENAARISEAIGSFGVDVLRAGAETTQQTMEALYSASRAAVNLANQTRAAHVIDGPDQMGWMFGQGSRHSLPPVGKPDSQIGLSVGSFGAGISPGDVATEAGIADLSGIATASGSSEPGNTPRAYFNAYSSGSTYQSLPRGYAYLSKVAKNPAEHLANEVKKAQAIEQLELNAAIYAKQADKLRKSVSPTVNRIHVARKDEDLRRISVKYYGTAKRWVELARVNNIDGSLPATGQRLIIPA